MDKKYSKYTDEELADAFVFPHDLSPEEKKKADEEMRIFRTKLLEEMTEEEKLYADFLRRRYQNDLE